MKCIVCERKFNNHEDEDVCPNCRRIASERTIEYFRKKGALKKTRKGVKNE